MVEYYLVEQADEKRIQEKNYVIVKNKTVFEVVKNR
jgi:hypothetical protein